MAENTISLKVLLEADTANMKLGQLEEHFAELQARIKEVPRGSKAFDDLSHSIARTSAEIKNIELGFEGLDREGVASQLGGLAGGIGEVTASLVLMGGENETMQEMAASIEKAMAISMGFKGAIEGLSAAKKLYNNLLKKGKVQVMAKAAAEKVAAVGTWMLNAANKALNTTMKMNPIGLVVIALTAVVGAIIYFKDAIWSAIKTLIPFDAIINAVVDALQWMGIMASDEAIAIEKAAKKKIESYQKQAKELEKLREAHERLSKKVIGDLDYELELLKAKGEDTADAEWAIVNQKKKAALEAKRIAIDEYKNSQKLLDFKKAQNKEITDDDIKAHNELVKNLKAAGDAYIEAGREQTIFFANRKRERKEQREKEAEAAEKAAKEASKKRREQREKDKAEASKQLIEDAKALAEFEEEQAQIKIQLIQDEGERARAEIDYNTQLELEALEKKGLLTFDAEMLIAQKKHKALAELEKAEDDKRLEAERQAQAKRDEYEKLLFDAKVANEQDETERQRIQIEEDFRNNIATLEEQGLLTTELEIELTMAREKALADIELERIEKVRQANLEATQERLESATQVIGAIGDLNSMALQNDLKNAGDNEAKKEQLRKASFEREKKLNIAMALVNGAQAQMSILAQTPKADFGIATAIAMAAAAVTTIAQIAAIKATSYQGGGSPVASESQNVSADGAGAAGGGAAITPVSNTSTILGRQQVFVTETDITETQNNVSVIEESATF